jgi:hypothetical protein
MKAAEKNSSVSSFKFQVSGCWSSKAVVGAGRPTRFLPGIYLELETWNLKLFPPQPLRNIFHAGCGKICGHRAIKHTNFWNH